MSTLDQLLETAANRYSAMKQSAADYDESLAALLAHPQAKAGATSADGKLTLIDNFAADNRVYRSQPFRRFEVAKAK